MPPPPHTHTTHKHTHLLALLCCRAAGPPCLQAPHELDQPRVHQRRIAAAIAASRRNLASRRSSRSSHRHGWRLPHRAQAGRAALVAVALRCGEEGGDKLAESV